MSTNSESDIDENIIYNILNEKNKYITREYIENTLKKYGIIHKVNKLEEFIIATVHISYMKIDLDNLNKKRYSLSRDKEVEPILSNNIKNIIPLQEISYERIEFLGDSIIRAILSEYFYDRYKKEDEGFLTKLRTKVEKGESLAKLCRAIGLNNYIIFSKYIEEKGGREQNTRIQEDVFEAFIGALHIDAGYDKCKNFLVNLIEKDVDLSDLLYNEDNYKDMLLRFFHTKKWGDPKYKLVSDTGSNIENKREFTMSVSNDSGKVMGIGSGTSKKKGEQEAAKLALEKFNFFDDEDSELEYEEVYGEFNEEDIDNMEYIED